MLLLSWAICLLAMVMTGDAKHHVRSTGSIIQASKTKAQRGFMIIYVRHQGFLLMKAVKAAKGEHYQLPGGRIDEEDFTTLQITTDAKELELDALVRVGKHAALRELWEETGINLKGQYERLEYLPGVTRKIQNFKSNKGTVSGTKFPRKLYYFLELHETEFDPANITLSAEHVGYVVEPDILTAAKQAALHSGGDSGRALQIFHDEMAVYLAAA